MLLVGNYHRLPSAKIAILCTLRDIVHIVFASGVSVQITPQHTCRSPGLGPLIEGLPVTRSHKRARGGELMPEVNCTTIGIDLGGTSTRVGIFEQDMNALGCQTF